jgi:predicted ABC-type transport system involved in lysophospholipase L1 biosynthesis ATPase subunit
VAELFHRLIDQGNTLLIVTHDENLARRADRVIQLKDGAIVADDRKTAARV